MEPRRSPMASQEKDCVDSQFSHVLASCHSSRRRLDETCCLSWLQTDEVNDASYDSSHPQEYSLGESL